AVVLIAGWSAALPACVGPGLEAVGLDGALAATLLGVALALSTFDAPLAARGAALAAGPSTPPAPAALAQRALGLGAIADPLGGDRAAAVGTAGRMEPAAALGFALLGLAVLAARRSARLSHGLALLVAAGGAVTLIGVFFGIRTLQGIA